RGGAVGGLSVVGLVPLVVGVRGGRPWRGAALGRLAGTIACNGLTSASTYAALLRARHPAWIAAGEALIIPQLCGALFFAGFGAFVAVLERRRPSTSYRIVLVPAAWIAGEFARSRIGDGMPWSCWRTLRWGSQGCCRWPISPERTASRSSARG